MQLRMVIAEKKWIRKRPETHGHGNHHHHHHSSKSDEARRVATFSMSPIAMASASKEKKSFPDQPALRHSGPKKKTCLGVGRRLMQAASKNTRTRRAGTIESTTSTILAALNAASQHQQPASLRQFNVTTIPCALDGKGLEEIVGRAPQRAERPGCGTLAVVLRQCSWLRIRIWSEDPNETRGSQSRCDAAEL